MNERPTHRLLIDESPFQFQPTLAVVLGLNEAIFIQQTHYWLQRSRNERDGRWWVYNTMEAWQRQFPWWSVGAIKRIVAHLEAEGLLLSAQGYNELSTDRTKWYAIDYARLEELSSGAIDRIRLVH